VDAYRVEELVGRLDTSGHDCKEFLRAESGEVAHRFHSIEEDLKVVQFWSPAGAPYADS
jgi:hypothetical protein